jgi:hypothetical protein
MASFPPADGEDQHDEGETSWREAITGILADQPPTLRFGTPQEEVVFSAELFPRLGAATGSAG